MIVHWNNLNWNVVPANVMENTEADEKTKLSIEFLNFILSDIDKKWDYCGGFHSLSIKFSYASVNLYRYKDQFFQLKGDGYDKSTKEGMVRYELLNDLTDRLRRCMAFVNFRKDDNYDTLDRDSYVWAFYPWRFREEFHNRDI
jgi:hypothetical protein